MKPRQNTTTGIRGGEGTSIRFSGQVPSFSIELAPADPSLRLGEMALSLRQRDAMIEDLTGRVMALESTLTYLKGAAGAEPDAIASLRESAEPADRRSEEITDDQQGGNDTDKTTKPELDLTPDENLAPAHQKQERIILYLLHCPDLTLDHSDAGGFLRKELGYETGQDWNNAKSTLKQRGILTAVKKSSESRRSTAIGLSIEALLESTGKPYMTPRVLETLKAGNTARDNDRSIESPTQTSPTPASSENNGQVHQISARTRRMMEQEPDPIPGYRTDGRKSHAQEGRPFLVPRRSISGARSGR